MPEYNKDGPSGNGGLNITYRKDDKTPSVFYGKVNTDNQLFYNKMTPVEKSGSVRLDNPNRPDFHFNL